MPTFTQIGSAVTVGAGGATSITFSSIPSTYTDLVCLVSGRGTGVYLNIYPNGSTSNLTGRYLYSSGSSPASGSLNPIMYLNESGQTANTFSSSQIYIPNYAGSTFKSISVESVQENNATGAQMIIHAGLWSSTAAITSLVLTVDQNAISQHTTAYLYGVSNA